MKVNELQRLIKDLPSDTDVVLGYHTEGGPRIEAVGDAICSFGTLTIKTKSFQDFMEDRYIGLHVLPVDTY